MIRYISSADRVVALSTVTLKDSVEEIVCRLVPGLSPGARKSLCESVLHRESLKSTVLPHGVAFPRAESEEVGKIMCAIGTSEEGIRVDGGSRSIHTLFLTLYPKCRFKEFVSFLDHLVDFSQDPRKINLLRKVPRDESAFEVVRSEVLPWGVRKWVYSHVLFPVQSLLSRMESVVKVRHG